MKRKSGTYLGGSQIIHLSPKYIAGCESSSKANAGPGIQKAWEKSFNARTKRGHTFQIVTAEELARKSVVKLEPQCRSEELRAKLQMLIEEHWEQSQGPQPSRYSAKRSRKKRGTAKHLLCGLLGGADPSKILNGHATLVPFSDDKIRTIRSLVRAIKSRKQRPE